MLNFKKRSIFDRSEKAQEDFMDEPGNQVLAVWGSPGSGKSTVAVKLAKYLAGKKRNVILLTCDMTAPMPPVSARRRTWKVNLPWEVCWRPPR